MGGVTVAPERSYEQRMAALQVANDVRSRRAKLKRDAKAGRVNLLDVLTEPPEFVHSMRAFDLLLAMPKVGRVKANKALMMLRVSPSRTVGGLSDRQRRELANWVGRRGW